MNKGEHMHRAHALTTQSVNTLDPFARKFHKLLPKFHLLSPFPHLPSVYLSVSSTPAITIQIPQIPKPTPTQITKYYHHVRLRWRRQEKAQETSNFTQASTTCSSQLRQATENEARDATLRACAQAGVKQEAKDQAEPE